VIYYEFVIINHAYVYFWQQALTQC